MPPCHRSSHSKIFSEMMSIDYEVIQSCARTLNPAATRPHGPFSHYHPIPSSHPNSPIIITHPTYDLEIVKLPHSTKNKIIFAFDIRHSMLPGYLPNLRIRRSTRPTIVQSAENTRACFLERSQIHCLRFTIRLRAEMLVFLIVQSNDMLMPYSKRKHQEMPRKLSVC